MAAPTLPQHTGLTCDTVHQLSRAASAWIAAYDSDARWGIVDPADALMDGTQDENLLAAIQDVQAEVTR